MVGQYGEDFGEVKGFPLQLPVWYRQELGSTVTGGSRGWVSSGWCGFERGLMESNDVKNRSCAPVIKAISRDEDHVFVNPPCAVFHLCDLPAQVRYQRGKARIRNCPSQGLVGADSCGGRVMD